jgi:hypothetical protein
VIARSSVRWRRVWLIVALSIASVGAREIQAQRTRRAPAPRIQPEVRADFVDARAPAAHLGVGFNVPASTYVRVGLVAAAGQAWANGTTTAAGRIDGLVRFVLDPLREFRWAPYASGGVGAIFDGDERWRGVLIGALGIEGPVTGRIVPAFEVGFGGGVRIGVVVRRAMPARR